MQLDWNPFVTFCLRRQRILVTTHVRPDGDALGSMLGLAFALESMGKKVYRVIPGSLPPRYKSLDPEGKILSFTDPAVFGDVDGIVVVDTGTYSQLGAVGEFIKSSRAERCVIDHHQTQDDLGGHRFVHPPAEATGRLIGEAIAALGMPLNAKIAHYLFIALAMDTGWFHHANTKPATFELAAKLVGAGAKPDAIYEELYDSNTIARLQLTGRVLARVRTAAAGRIAYTEVHADDYNATGAVPLDTEDLVNYPRSVSGAEIGLIFIEEPEGQIKVSFRSREIDVSQLAEQFGGGGHKLAAGAILPGPLAEARDKVLAASAAALG